MKNKENIWYLYLLECRDGSYYTGITNNLDKRMKKHRKGNGSKYVKARGFKKLLRSKKCNNKSEALKCEYEVKQLPKFEKLIWFKN